MLSLRRYECVDQEESVMSRFVSLSVAGLLDRRRLSPCSPKVAVAQGRADLFRAASIASPSSIPGNPRRAISRTRRAPDDCPGTRISLPRRSGPFCGDRRASSRQNSPVVDDAAVEHAAEQIRQKGGRINQQFKEPYDPGMPGRQLNITYPERQAAPRVDLYGEPPPRRSPRRPPPKATSTRCSSSSRSR